MKTVLYRLWLTIAFLATVVLCICLIKLRQLQAIEMARINAGLAEQDALNKPLRVFQELADRRKRLETQSKIDSDVIADFYRSCRDVSDLPILETDLIINERNTLSQHRGWRGFFSVPEGNHRLMLTITEWKNGQKTEPIYSFEFPLASASGFELSLQRLNEADPLATPLVVEIQSNNATFESVKKELPIAIGKVSSSSYTETKQLACPNEMDSSIGNPWTSTAQGIEIANFSWMTSQEEMDQRWTFQAFVMSDCPACMHPDAFMRWQMLKNHILRSSLNHALKGRYVFDAATKAE